MHMSLNLPPGMGPAMGPAPEDMQAIIKQQQKQQDEGRRATAMHLAIQRREGGEERLTVTEVVDEARVIARFLRDG